MAQELDLELGLAPYDPWVLKKNLTESDLSLYGFVILPKQDFEKIIPQMERGLVENLGNGVEVKVHIVEEGHESDGGHPPLTLIKCSGRYMLKGGWYNLVKAKGYKT
ncbi:unnamed protein product [Arabidopsis halleri]